MRVLNLPRFLVFAMACAALTPAMAQEQTRAELQQENRALRDELEKQTTRISQLESRVDQLLSERRSLMGTLRQTENLISNLRRQLGATDAPPQRRLMAQPPADALASPESMLRELRNQYRVNMLNVPNTTDAEKAEYIKQLKLWCRLTHQNLRGKRTWLVKLEDMARLGKDSLVVRMTVLDETSGLPIGEAFDVQFPKRFQDQFNRGSKTDRWEVTSIVIAKPAFNERHVKRGVFEYPTLVGPMVEFDFELNWQGLRAWEPSAEPEAEEDQPADEPAASADPNS